MNPNEPNPTEAENLPAELRQFEAQLKRLSPHPSRLDRDRLIFLAGQASIRRSSTWAWPIAFAASTAVAASLLFLLVTQPQNNPTLDAFVSSPPISEPTGQAQPTGRHSPYRPSHILSSAPNQLHRLEKFLASGYREPLEGGPTVDWGDGKRLTPTSARLLMNEPAKRNTPDGNTQLHAPENGAHA